MMNEYLASSEVIDWDHSAVRECADRLGSAGDVVAVARACFEWVRDEVQHSRDFERSPTTWRASDVLQQRTGYCYAKSHLLAALLRANGIPAGLCYQRLSVNDSGPPYCLHGFNAIYLAEFGWYRVDPRGNRAEIDARFTPPVERLAFPLQSAEEVEFENVFAEPLQCVLNVLRANETWQSVLAELPDIRPEEFQAAGLVVRCSWRESAAGSDVSIKFS
jgi:transglutaminase-like putative cysteine protease